MYCAWCSEACDATPCSTCGHEPLLDGRYRLDHPLGRGATGVTWAATRLSDGELVAIKAVPLPPGIGDKERELVGREVEVLRQIDHPAVPSLLDAFTVRGGAGVRVQYLVQTFMAGRTLDEELAARRFDEDEVLAVMEEVLPILAHLHGRSPPVVHRDIKPKNLIRRTDGGLALIDFGAVKGALSHPDFGGSTVAGTFGYMAPEQFAGDASPRSDLYALGVVAVALLSREEPRTLLEGGRLQWRGRVRVSAGTAALLQALLEVDPEARPPDADTVLRRVRALRSVPTGLPAPPAPRLPTQPLPTTSVGWPLFGAAAVGVVVLLAVSAGSRREEEKAATAVAPPPSCGDAPCAPLEAFAIRGLRFGQTRDEAAAAFPELAEATDAGPLHVSAPFGVLDLDLDTIGAAIGSSETLPGEVLSVRTTIAEALARCELAFVVDHRLSRVSCVVDAEGDAPVRPVVEWIAAVITERHGAPTAHREETILGWEGWWTWADPTGGVELHATDHRMFGITRAELSLEAETAGHQQAVRAAEERARRAADAARAEAAREREAARQRELDALRERIGDAPGGL